MPQFGRNALDVANYRHENAGLYIRRIDKGSFSQLYKTNGGKASGSPAPSPAQPQPSPASHADTPKIAVDFVNRFQKKGVTFNRKMNQETRFGRNFGPFLDRTFPNTFVALSQNQS